MVTQSMISRSHFDPRRHGLEMRVRRLKWSLHRLWIARSALCRMVASWVSSGSLAPKETEVKNTRKTPHFGSVLSILSLLGNSTAYHYS